MTRLATALEKKPMSVKELALATGYHERTIKRHLAGLTKMDEDQIVAYAKALGMTPAELIEAAA